MTYKEALLFFARFGNVSNDIEGLKRETPNKSQLNDCVWIAVNRHNQDMTLAEQARDTILSHQSEEAL